MSKFADRKVTRFADSTYAFAGCTIRLTGDTRWLVSCHGEAVTIADCMVDAEAAAQAHYVESVERATEEYTEYSMRLGEMGCVDATDGMQAMQLIMDGATAEEALRMIK